MERITFVLYVLCAMVIYDNANAQSQHTESYFWIHFELQDYDNLMGSRIIQSDWSEPCTSTSPQSLRDWMPLGYRQDLSDSVVKRTLPPGRCERVLPIKVSGVIGGELVFPTLLPWQPGINNLRIIGIPKQDTQIVTIVFPKTTEIDGQWFAIESPISIQVSSQELATKIQVQLRRLPEIIFQKEEDSHPTPKLKQVLVSTTGRTFVMPDEQHIHVSKGYSIEVSAKNPSGHSVLFTRPQDLTTQTRIPAWYGWIFTIHIQSTRPTFKDWILASRKQN